MRSSDTPCYFGDRKIGEVFFDSDGTCLVVESADSCEGCYFDSYAKCVQRSIKTTGYCHKSLRADKKDVKFNKIDV